MQIFQKPPFCFFKHGKSVWRQKKLKVFEKCNKNKKRSKDNNNVLVFDYYTFGKRIIKIKNYFVFAEGVKQDEKK